MPQHLGKRNVSGHYACAVVAGVKLESSILGLLSLISSSPDMGDSVAFQDLCSARSIYARKPKLASGSKPREVQHEVHGTLLVVRVPGQTKRLPRLHREEVLHQHCLELLQAPLLTRLPLHVVEQSASWIVGSENFFRILPHPARKKQPALRAHSKSGRSDVPTRSASSPQTMTDLSTTAYGYGLQRALCLSLLLYIYFQAYSD